MIFLGIISVVAIGFFCWLVFTLAVLALPFFAGVMVATVSIGSEVGTGIGVQRGATELA